MNTGTTKKSADPVAKTEEETLVQAIRKISDAVQRLQRSGINRDAIEILLRHETKLGAKVIQKVLGGLAALEKRFTN